MHRPRVWLIAGSLLVFLLSYFSLSSEVYSDPKLTLLVSQALIDHRTIYLDVYEEDTILDRPFEDYLASGDILKTGEHYSHYFPVGPSLLSVPFVGLARLAAGWDMRTSDNYHLQEILSALTTMGVFLLSYALARCYASDRSALVIAFVSVLGSSLISTLGTAFWSHNFAVLFISGVLLLLARVDSGKSDSLYPLALGTLLFLAFLCRASAVGFILPVFGYLAMRQRRSLLPVGIVALALLLLYLFWSFRMTGTMIAAYYSPVRLTVERMSLWVGIVGNLISPGRGILVFSPFLLVVLAGYLAFWKTLFRKPMVWMCLVWFGLHLVIVARAASWWGGESFGPRLLTDLWPGIIILTAIWWAVVEGNHNGRIARIWGVTYLGLALPAIIINAVIGLNSQPALRWNRVINPIPNGAGDNSGGDLFNWRYPQMMASNSTLCKMEREKLDHEQFRYLLAPYEPGQVITYNADRILTQRPATPSLSPHGALPMLSVLPESSRAVVYLPIQSTPGNLAHFLGWAEPTNTDEVAGLRWSQCEQAEIRFYLAESLKPGDLTLEFRGLSLDRQRVSYFLNDTFLGQQLWTGDKIETQKIHLDSELLQARAVNVLTFKFPDAHYPSLREQRLLGLALESITFWEGEIPIAPALPDKPEVAYPAP